LQRRRPTILDVAQRAGVSVGTVSNVLNAPASVSEARRERVLKAIEALGYSQNLLAHGLRKRRSNMVGLCVPHTSNAYFSALVNAFEEMASDRGFELLQVLSRHDSRKEYERVSALLKYKIGGLILVPGLNSEKTLKLIARSGTPLVIVDRLVQNDRIDHVSFDNRGAMFEAARRLIALGHRRILFIVRERGLLVTQRRLEGLRAAASAAPEKVTTNVFECQYDEVMLTTRLSGEFRKPRPPTAIIVSNSTFAAMTLRALRALRVNFPSEVSLLAFDQPDWADLVTPRLSVVKQPTEAIARRAWEFLIRRMADEADGVQREQLQAEVIFRESIEPVPDKRAVARSADPPPADGSKARTSVRDHARSR
jgi:LacI family transcriptional regulator